MAESREYIARPDEKGSINISQDVVALIAANAAMECEGVEALSTVQGKDRLQGKNLSRAVKIFVSDDAVKADVYIVVRMGYAVNDVGRAVQQAVAAAVESTTGLNVAAVDVHISGMAVLRQ